MNELLSVYPISRPMSAGVRSVALSKERCWAASCGMPTRSWTTCRIGDSPQSSTRVATTPAGHGNGGSGLKSRRRDNERKHASNSIAVDHNGLRGPGDGVSLTINGAVVTYVKPPIGSDSGGFFLQATATGPGHLREYQRDGRR